MMKKIISLLLALSLALTLGVALVGCSDENGDNGGAGNNGGDTTDTKETYTVTVKDSAGNAISGVELSMIKVTSSGEMPYPGAKETDSDGKAFFEVKAGEWKLSVDDVPADYVLPENAFTFTDKAVTVTLELLPTYTIKVVDQDGNPVVGARVQMCKKGEAGACVPYKNPTDENGETKNRIEADSYEAQVTAVPEGYTAPTEYFDFEGSSATGYTVTIKVTKN